jgi:hypothetical protein
MKVRVSAYLRDELGPVIPESNNDRDLRILAALHADAANFLVSDDDGLRRRAKRIEIGDRVLTLYDAVATLEGFESTVTTPPPMVSTVQSYALDFDQDILATIRADDLEFDQWKAKVQGDSTNRECVVIKESYGTYAAIAILKIDEADYDFDFTRPIAKISISRELIQLTAAQRHFRHNGDRRRSDRRSASRGPRYICVLHCSLASPRALS